MQKIADFFSFSDDLKAIAESDSRVLGLIWLGSAAQTARVDEWSDHDFFLVVKVGEGEAFRSNLSWLPQAESVAILARETAHGLKVVYENGHVLEFAVFEDPELELAAVNFWAVAVDKQDITERMVQIESNTHASVFEEEREWGLFLALILIAVGRARRGEILIAGQAIRSYCFKHVVGFLRDRRVAVPGTEGLSDNLDRFRRLERQFPVEARELELMLQMPVEDSASAQLEFVLSLGGFSAEQLAQAAVVRRRLGWE